MGKRHHYLIMVAQHSGRLCYRNMGRTAHRRSYYVSPDTIRLAMTVDILQVLPIHHTL
jgi:hypothetical protein